MSDSGIHRMSRLPLALGLIVAIAGAWFASPVPRLPGISIATLFDSSIRHLALTIIPSTVIFAAISEAISRKRCTHSQPSGFLDFACAVAWLPPLWILVITRSPWALPIAAIISVSIVRIFRPLREIPETPGDKAYVSSTRLAAMLLAALCLELGLGFAAAGLLVAASATVAVCTALIIRFYAASGAIDRETAPTPRVTPGLPLLFATCLTMFSLTPYLGVGTSSSSLLSRIVNFALTVLGRPPDYPVAQNRSKGLPSLWPKPEAIPAGSKGKNGRPSRVSPHPGMILRPEPRETVTLVPPLPRLLKFDSKLSKPRPLSKPLTIPFFGVYWLYRRSDRTLPPDAIEANGDPSTVSFRTTDMTPMAMEARQNLGIVVDLTCCKAIEVAIHNADRRSNTVQIELVLINTTVPEHPSESLGKLDVRSTPENDPDSGRTPAEEVLTFPVPPGIQLNRFDEIVIRFHLQPPRRPWSAQMSVDRLRLIPRGF